MVELPVFELNDFFKAKAKKEGINEVEAYAEAMRVIIANATNVPLVDMAVEDKLEYKNILNAAAKGKKYEPKMVETKKDK
jgi:hypothetical protein